MLVVLVAERRLPDIERSGGRRRGERKRAKEDEAGESFGGAWRRETHTHTQRFNNAVDPERVPLVGSRARAAGRPLVRLQ